MNRRKFMATTAMTAASVAIPFQAISAPTVLKAETALEYVFRIMKEYGFHTVKDKAALFSYYPYQFETEAQLLDLTTKPWFLASIDTRNRLVFLMTIRQKLSERFGDNLTAHIEWLDQPHADFNGLTPREKMLMLHYADMQHVALTLEDEGTA